MLEIEQKYADADFAALERRLAEWGVSRFEEHEEEDQYLAAPDRDFRVTGEAFRMRRVGESAFLTYKGPKQPSEVKMRPELELPLPPGRDMAEQYLQLFRYLGYRPVAVVRKRRRQYALERDGFAVNVCLDDVEQLGRFAEAAEGKLALIAAGGIDSGAEAYARIRAGASAVQVYSALVFEGPALVSRIKRELAQLLRAEGFRNVNDAVGAR